VNNSKINICVTLPSLVAYSETFLQAHLDRLSGIVNYLGDFPVHVDEVFPRQISADQTEQLKRQVRVLLHRYVLNLIKKNSLRKFFKRNNVNVVLAEYGLTGIGVYSACKELSMPLVVHFHGSDAYSIELLERHKYAYKRMFEYASAIIAVSRHMTEQLVNLGAPAEKLFYNPYGVEIAKFEQSLLLTAPPQVLAVGRFVEKKAPYLTILAFNKVLNRLPEARLVMVGAGVLHDVCSKLIKALHIEHAVELKGAVDHDGVASLMQRSRVFVQHSLVPASGDTEGTPVAILEAGAAGLPVVSTRHAGITDVVIHGKTGFLVDEGDVDGMSEYMYQLLNDPELASQMGKDARAYISANFTMEHSIEKLRKILEGCVVRNPTAIRELTPNQAADIIPRKQSRSHQS
jgi:colanic acid/amylovoran biosynthesis glycosyltransferase